MAGRPGHGWPAPWAPPGNLVWKDTVLLRAGETADILLDVTNPGLWMAHCTSQSITKTA